MKAATKWESHELTGEALQIAGIPFHHLPLPCALHPLNMEECALN